MTGLTGPSERAVDYEHSVRRSPNVARLGDVFCLAIPYGWNGHGRPAARWRIVDMGADTVGVVNAETGRPHQRRFRWATIYGKSRRRPHDRAV
jgi:hypothetical protein